MIKRKRLTRAWALTIAGAALLAGGCGGDDGTGPPKPQPGQLTVNVSATGSPGAAFLLTVRGTNITDPVAANSGHKLYTFASGDTLKAAVIGTVSSGALLKFSVPDVNQASGYRVSLNQVAGTDNALIPVASFGVTIGQ
jgi:hypothetical protein